VDTWHILEQRFHEIGNRDHCLAMTFEKEDDEKYWYYLEGGLGQQYLGDGRWAGVLIGAPHPDAPVSPKKIERDDYAHSNLFETLQRAGRLLNKDEGRSWSDWEGSRRFVKLLVDHYGSPVIGLLFEDGDAKFFTNAACVCGMLAGKLAAEKISITDNPPGKKKPPKNCRASKNDVRKFEFYEKARGTSPHMTYGEAANHWNDQFKDDQSEEGMRQAVNRCKKFRQWQRDNL